MCSRVSLPSPKRTIATKGTDHHQIRVVGGEYNLALFFRTAQPSGDTKNDGHVKIVFWLIDCQGTTGGLVKEKTDQSRCLLPGEASSKGMYEPPCVLYSKTGTFSQ
jgi:hypothetical protein